MSTFYRVAAFVGAIIALGYGAGERGEQANGIWLACLGIVALLLIVAAWPRRTRQLPVFSRTMLRVTTIIFVCFFVVSLQLVRLQIVDADRTSSRVGEAPNGEVVINPRERLAAIEMRRGRILDSEGRVLADTVQRDDGTWQRTWPELSTAALIGYYSPLLYGASNLEERFDDYLAGQRGGNPAEEWLQGVLHEQEHGYDLQLTIDLDLQRKAEELLAGRPGAVVLLDPHTGAVLAMAGAPGLDPNRLYANQGQQTEEELAAIADYWAQLNADAGAPLLFRPTQGLYNPGSTFKTVTASALVDAGLAAPDRVFRDEGLYEVEGRVIEEPNRPDPSVIDYTLREAFAYSLNVVFAKIGIELRAETLWDYAQRFGFGEALPFDISTFETQLASSRDALNNRALLADTGFGQGQILATPLQMAMVVAAVVNDGMLMEPYLVDRVLDDQGEELRRFGADEWRRAISGQTAEIMRDLLLASVQLPNAYAAGAAIDGLTVGGKTGTAELQDAEPHSWFTGFAESEERTVVVAVVVEHGGPGSSAALPIGRALLEAALRSE